MRQVLIATIALIVAGCSATQPDDNQALEKSNNDKIQVLNFGTFHFGYTPDGTTVDYDENSKSAEVEARQLAKMIAEFKPTIICVERRPIDEEHLNKAYQDYLNNPEQLSRYGGEIGMVAFEVAKLQNIEYIEGIDFHQNYGWSLGDDIESHPDLENTTDPQTYRRVSNNPYEFNPQFKQKFATFNEQPLLEKLKMTNDPVYLDNMIVSNADKLMYADYEGNLRGAEEAAKFYERNMKIYQILNKIPMNKTDRVFILMGAAHTAFLREFIKRSHKFEMVDTVSYLK